jgi:hypothetical protein
MSSSVMDEIFSKARIETKEVSTYRCEFSDDLGTTTLIATNNDMLLQGNTIIQKTAWL